MEIKKGVKIDVVDRNKSIIPSILKSFLGFTIAVAFTASSTETVVKIKRLLPDSIFS